MTTAVDSRATSGIGSSAVPAPLSAIGRWLTAADHVRVGASLVVSAFVWALVADGWRVGLVDAAPLLVVDMHDSGREAWREWGRSLALPGVASGRAAQRRQA